MVNTGIKKKTYYFGCNLVDGYWELDMAFVARREGVYEIYPAIIDVRTREASLPKGTRMLGDSEKFGARVKLVAKNNRIGLSAIDATLR